MTLLTAVRYGEITGDTTSVVFDSASVSARLEEAEELLEDYLDRPLALAERTETMRPDRNGWLWPRATPITDGGSYVVEGAALIGGFASSVGIFDASVGVDVTYTGGWTADTLPRAIERDLAFAAHRLLHATPPSSEIPEGAVSVRLGDAALTFGPGGARTTGDTDSWWSARTKGYRYRRVDSGGDLRRVRL